MSASVRERDHDADESTPLLARRSSTSDRSPRRPHQSRRLVGPAPYAETTTPDTQSTQHPIARAARILAALRIGHLPTSAQLVALSRLALDADALAPDRGTVWQPRYGRGRIGTGKLSDKGEQVRLAARRAIEAVIALVEQRNPALRYKYPEGVWVTASTPGDGWQEFAWACTKSRIQFDPPSTRLPSAPPDAQTTLRSSLWTLLHLLLASPSLRRLLADLALLLRDLLRLQLESVKQDGNMRARTQESLAKVVDKAAEKAVGQEELVKHDLEGQEGLDGGRVGPDLKPEQGAEEIRGKIMDRFEEVVIEIQRTKGYQHAVRDLLQLARDYIRRLVEEIQPQVEVVVPEEPEPTATTSSPGRVAPATASGPQGSESRAAVARDPLEMVLPLLEPYTEKGPGSLSSLAPRFRLLFASPTAASELPSSTDDPNSEPEVMVRPPQEHLSLLAADIDHFVSTALLEPGWLGSDASYQTLGAIQDRLDGLGQDCPVWASEVRSLASELASAIGSVVDDPLLRAAGEAVEELIGAMGRWGVGLGEVVARTATGGGAGLASAVWGDVVEWLAPRVMGVLSEIPLPRLEFTTESVAIALEPPSLISTSFVPARITWHQSSALTYSPSSGDSTLALPLSASHPATLSSSASSSSDRMTYTTKSVLSVEGIQFEVLDVGYFASYKTGIPCFGDITERGLLDLHFGVDPAAPTDPSISPRGEGLAFDLAVSTSGPRDGVPSTAPLFTVDHSRTVVHLRDFRLEPHQSSHPWLMWFFRPLLRKAVQTVIEKEMKEKVLEAGAEWIAQKGAEVRRRRRKQGADEGAPEPEPWSREALWRWIRAGWDVFVGQEGGAQESDSTPEPTEEHPDRPFHVHVTSRGIAANLDNLEATVGLGAEGVVIPAGEAEIPLPEGQAPKKGVVQAARDEVAHEVQEGREAARAGVDAFGGMLEARGEWRAAHVPASGVTWRSTAFDV